MQTLRRFAGLPEIVNGNGYKSNANMNAAQYDGFRLTQQMGVTTGTRRSTTGTPGLTLGDVLIRASRPHRERASLAACGAETEGGYSDFASGARGRNGTGR